jgi:hypothetical protein
VLVAGGLLVGVSAGAAQPLAAGPLIPRARSVTVTPQPVGSSCPSAAGKAPGPGERCVRLPVSLVLHKSTDPSGTCVQVLYMIVALRVGIVEYGAAWRAPNVTSPWIFTSTSGGPYGQTWSETSIVYSGVTYKLPSTHGGWWIGEGAFGNGHCSGVTGSAKAWGWTRRR